MAASEWIRRKKLGAGAVKAPALGSIIEVESGPFGVLPGGDHEVTAACPAGTRVISGGAIVTDGARLLKTAKAANGWQAIARNPNPGSIEQVTARSYCLAA